MLALTPCLFFLSALVVPHLLDLGKIFGAPVALYLMARFITRRDKARDEAALTAAKEGKETADEKKAWREARLLAEKTLKEAVADEKSERLLWQLKREAESAIVVGILEENAEAQKILASIVSTTRHLEGGQTRLDQDVRELRGHIGTIQTQLLTLANSRNANS